MIATIGYGYLSHLRKIRDRVELIAIANHGIERPRQTRLTVEQLLVAAAARLAVSQGPGCSTSCLEKRS